MDKLVAPSVLGGHFISREEEAEGKRKRVGRHFRLFVRLSVIPLCVAGILLYCTVLYAVCACRDGHHASWEKGIEKRNEIFQGPTGGGMLLAEDDHHKSASKRRMSALNPFKDVWQIASKISESLLQHSGAQLKRIFAAVSV